MWLKQWPYGPSEGQSPPEGVQLKLVESWTDARGRTCREETAWVDNGSVSWLELNGDWLTNYERTSRMQWARSDTEPMSNLGRHRWWLEGLTLKRRP